MTWCITKEEKTVVNNNAMNVTTGKPKIGGAIFRAPAGSTLPVGAKAELADAYANLGYVSEDGVTNSNSMETGEIRAWGGDVVDVYQENKSDTYQFTLIEVLRVDVLKAVYGDDNVSGDLDSGITIKANSAEQDENVYVIDTIARGALRRIVIPNGKLTEVGDVNYTDTDAVGYEMTITALPDGDGNTHYEYIINK